MLCRHLIIDIENVIFFFLVLEAKQFFQALF